MFAARALTKAEAAYIASRRTSLIKFSCNALKFSEWAGYLHFENFKKV